MGPGGGMHCEEHFAHFDANSDGSITEQEFTTLPHAHADPRSVFASRDRNHDGTLSKDEFCSPWNPPPAKP
jgi:Ca2+-binding EF-hand superfamily protein